MNRKYEAGGQENSQDVVELLAEKLEAIQDRLRELTIQGPEFGTIWCTYPEREEDLFGPLVVILDAGSHSNPQAIVAEASQDLDHGGNLAIFLKGNTRDLHFSCIVRLDRVFLIPRTRLRTCAGKLSSEDARSLLATVGALLATPGRRQSPCVSNPQLCKERPKVRNTRQKLHQ